MFDILYMIMPSKLALEWILTVILCVFMLLPTLIILPKRMYSINRYHGKSMLPTLPPFGYGIYYRVHDTTKLSVGDIICFAHCCTKCTRCGYWDYQSTQHRISRIEKARLNNYMDVQKLTTKGDNELLPDCPIIHQQVEHKLICNLTPYWFGWILYWIVMSWERRQNTSVTTTTQKRKIPNCLCLGQMIHCNFCNKPNVAKVMHPTRVVLMLREEVYK